MKFSIFGVIGMAALVAGPAAAQDPDGARFTFKGAGDGDWSVECRLTLENGDERDERVEGRGASRVSTISVSDVVAAACSVDVAEGAHASLTLDSDADFACPFEVAVEGGYCRARFAGPTAFEFDVARQ